MESAASTPIPRWVIPIQFVVGGAGALGAILALVYSEYVVALALVGATIALVLVLAHATRSASTSPATRDISHRSSGLAIAGVGLLALIIGVVLWWHSGTISQSVSLFAAGVGFIAAGLVAARVPPNSAS
ncbi:hypothetical protein SAMN02910418_02185 [Bowdeniella nasicola]|uniref:Uncharacterized protein n=1 Tax=Bowdeniella nasicola TaxID=208480 RepID=A0A1H4D8H3_9ACTO|nr:hypothetical protein SAMN02910418_02185 [Bowdeniella nasicola]